MTDSDNPEQTVNKSNGSSVCYRKDNNSATAQCRHCGQDFCNLHRSRYDARYCADCVSDETLKTRDEPLVDDDGVTHPGRVIKLIGQGWPHHMEMISSLSEEQLDARIIELRRLLEDAIRTSEFFRITLCAAEFDKEERYRSKIRKLRDRRRALEQGVLMINSKKKRMRVKKGPRRRTRADQQYLNRRSEANA